jgi:hypothetical protein
MTRRSMAVAFVLTAAFGATTTSLVVGQTWPVVRPMDQTFAFQDPDRAVVKTFVLDASGRQLYLFVCRTGDDAAGPPNVIYAGALDCRLMEARGGEREVNLLLETRGVAAWYSRGHMFPYELMGDCAVDPEYGLIRDFRVRGMKLVLSFEDVQFTGARDSTGPRLASYQLRLTVSPEPSARRDIAENSGYLESRESVLRESSKG